MIPKIFHRAWVGTKEMSAEFEAYWHGWRDHHPDWHFMTWDDYAINEFGLENRSQYDGAQQPAGKTDIAMYEILQRFGGVWLCCDMECFKNIEPLIGDASAFCGCQMPGELLGAIMGFAPNHPLIDSLVKGIPESVAHYDEITAIAGPRYLTRMMERCLDVSATEMYGRDDLLVLEPKLVYPFLWTEEFAGRDAYPEAYCCHHWAGSWK